MPDSNDGGEFTGTETMRGRDWPCLRQFCVFLENRVGRLNDLVRQVESMDTRVMAMSIVDSVDFAMVRMMFNNADRAREKLELSGFLFSESDVVGVELPDGHSFILVSDFNIVRFQLPDTVNQAIEAKEAAKQSLVRYKYLLQEAALEAQRREIEAGGIKRFQEIVAPTISDSFLRWRGIEATLALAQSPNSKIVVIGGSAGLPLILDGRGDTAAASPTSPATASPSPTMDQSYWNRKLDSSMLFPPTYKDTIVPQGLPAPPKSGALADPAGQDPAKTTVAKP